MANRLVLSSIFRSIPRSVSPFLSPTKSHHSFSTIRPSLSTLQFSHYSPTILPFYSSSNSKSNLISFLSLYTLTAFTISSVSSNNSPLQIQCESSESSPPPIPDSTSFPAQITPASPCTNTYSLINIGCRTMTPLKIRVYDIGFYLTSETLSQFRKQEETISNKNISTSNSLWKCNPEYVIRMVVAKNVNGKHIQHGYDRALIPRVRYAAKEMDLLNGKQALKQLNQCFLDKNLFPTNTVILLVGSKDGIINVFIEDVFYKQIDSKALSWALLDMFLGESPVSYQAKQNITDSLYETIDSVDKMQPQTV